MSGIGITAADRAARGYTPAELRYRRIPGRDGRPRHVDRRPGRLASEERTESARNHPYRWT